MSAVKKSLVLAAVFLGFFANSTRAQGVGILTFDVPFSFVVGHKQLPSGQYFLRTNEVGSATFIRGVKDGPVALAATMPAGGGDPAGDTPALVFTRYENTYQLAQIWQSTTAGRELVGHTAARATAREKTPLASSVPETYVVLATNWK